MDFVYVAKVTIITYIHYEFILHGINQTITMHQKFHIQFDLFEMPKYQHALTAVTQVCDYMEKTKKEIIEKGY